MNDAQPLPLNSPWWADNGYGMVRDLLSACLADGEEANWPELTAQLTLASPSPAACAAIPHLIAKLRVLSPTGLGESCQTIGTVLAHEGTTGLSACPSQCEPALLRSLDELTDDAWAVAKLLRDEPTSIARGLLSALHGATRLSQALVLGWDNECETQCPRCDEYARLVFGEDGITSRVLGPPERNVGQIQPGNRAQHSQLLAKGMAMLRAPQKTWSEPDLCCALAAFCLQAGHEFDATGLLYLAGTYSCWNCGEVTGVLDGRDNT